MVEENDVGNADEDFYPAQDTIQLTERLVEPSSKNKNLSKDFVIGNIKEREKRVIERKMELANILVFIGDNIDKRFKKMEDIILPDIETSLVLSRSVDGFERKAQTTITKINRIEEKKKGWF